MSLFCREKQCFFNNLDTKKLVDNKRFWRTVKPFFSDKNRVKNKITLIEEKTKIVSNNNLMAETFNKFFANIVPSLGLQCKDELLASVEHIQDPLEKIIGKSKQHPSIIAIMKHRPNKSNFSFSRVAKQSIESLIKTLDSSKTIQKYNIPTKIIKENINIMSNIFHEDINKCFSESFFPDDLKRAEVIPVFKKHIKKDSKTLKENCRPVSILSNISKIYETCLYNELSNYSEDTFSDYQFGFRKGISSQQCLIILIETWKKHIDNKESFRALLTDLSKAFDCINHELLLAKLHGYGIDNSSLRLIHSYLNNRQQRVRIDNEFSKWSDIKDGVPQGSILGPLFFNIHISDLLYIMRNWPVANYADDTAPYTGGKNTQDVITSLENCALVLFKWFENNLMKANSDKSHLLLSRSTSSTANINGDIIKNSESEKHLGVTIDYKLNFEEHFQRYVIKPAKNLMLLHAFLHI